MVTKLARERGFAAIKLVAKAMIDGEKFITYRDLAQRLQMANETGQGLGHILNYATSLCSQHKLPDVSSVVVTADSLSKKAPLPSISSFDDDGFWRVSGIHVTDVPKLQKEVPEFDWVSVVSLNL